MDIEALRDDLDYDASSGVFRWRHGVRTGNGALRLKPMDIAGTRSSDGYWQIRWRGKIYRAHRLAWLHVYGRWPSKLIDHINGDPLDNRIANLREASYALNNANSRIRKNNKSGYKGVSWSENAGRWGAWFSLHGKTRHLGYFDSPEAAHEAYFEAASAAFGEFARAA